jgi:hypothetical protein
MITRLLATSELIVNRPSVGGQSMITIRCVHFTSAMIVST